MTTKEFATHLASLLRKRAVVISTNGVTRGLNDASEAIASTLGEIADDIEKLATSMSEEPKKTSHKRWENL